MNFFIRVACFSLICSVSPLSLVYAQDTVSDAAPSMPIVADGGEVAKVEPSSMEVDVDEDRVLSVDEAKALMFASSEANDAVKGNVKPIEDNEYYDIYTRSLAFRESAKELRASLDTRRVKYEEPRVGTLEAYRVLQEKVYAAEMADYNKDDVGDDSIDGVEDYMPVAVPTEYVVSKNDNHDVAGGGLTEIDIPQKEGSDDPAKRKVITSEDAPDFDPSRL